MVGRGNLTRRPEYNAKPSAAQGCVLNLHGLELEGLTPLGVTVEGAWLAPPRRDWQGRATAAGPYVAINFVSAGAQITWTRSSDRNSDMGVRLMLGAYDAAGLDVQVNFGVGSSACVARCGVPSRTYLPQIPPRREFRCGKVEHFVLLGGTPPVNVSVLLIARQDVKSARNRLWHLWPELAARVRDPQIRQMLTYGRTGVLRG